MDFQIKQLVSSYIKVIETSHQICPFYILIINKCFLIKLLLSMDIKIMFLELVKFTEIGHIRLILLLSCPPIAVQPTQFTLKEHLKKNLTIRLFHG